MAFDFPSAPAVGDTFESGGIKYTWSGTAWDLFTAASAVDYVLKAGDTMIGAGALSFNTPAFNISANVNFDFNIPTGAAYKFYANSVEKVRIDGSGTSNGIVSQGHIRAQGGSGFAFDRSADNQSGIYFYGAQIRSLGGGNEGKFEFWTDNGGWSSVAIFNTTIGSGGGGLNVRADVSALSFTDRGAASTKSDIRDCNDAEIRDAFAALKPKRFRKNIPAPAPTKEKPWPIPPNKLRWGFVVDDIYANPATKDIATMAYVAGTDGKEFEPEGTDIMQVLALAVAKIKLLEAEIELLKKKR